jgi:transposase
LLRERLCDFCYANALSGWVEGLNNKIKALKRRCYGIANPISLFRRVWLDLSGYEAFAH